MCHVLIAWTTIYKNALLTIAAASSSDVKSGFLENRQVPIISQLPAVCSDGSYRSVYVSTVETKPSADEPLDQRGWTFQETFLSPRVFYYGSKDLVWKCQVDRFEPVVPTHNLYQETHAQLRIPALPPGVFRLKHPDSRWNSLSWLSGIYNYSQRSVRLLEDRFRALGGIAEELHLALGDVYLAGMWRSSLITQLAWKHVQREDKVMDQVVGSRKSPTWSWLTLSKPVEFWTWNGLSEDANVIRGYLTSWILQRHSAMSRLDDYNFWLPSFQLVRCQLIICGPMISISWKTREALDQALAMKNQFHEASSTTYSWVISSPLRGAQSTCSCNDWTKVHIAVKGPHS